MLVVGPLIALGTTAAHPWAAKAANGLFPLLDCVDYDSVNNVVTAHFGYANDNITPITTSPPDDFFDPAPLYRGQPLTYAVGRYHDQFTVDFPADSYLTWNLFGSGVTAVNDANNYCHAPDTTPPDTAILNGPTGTVNSASAAFDLFSEAGATFQCSLDGADFTGCATPYALTNLTDGTHTV